jgi:tetratricopeptide (TPR) repeat protein
LLDGILEAGWLAAMVVTPLFFNIYSSRVFEPDKLTTLRSIALVMAAAWLIRLVEEIASRRAGRDQAEPIVRITWRTPLVGITLFTVLVYVICSLLSVNPLVSFLGSYQRLQGTFTTLSYIIVFFIILDRMRTRAQVDRFITTLIVNSLPIALYGFVQHSRLDPLPWGGDVTRRIASNMGNAIFVAAYMIMAVFPTLSRIVDSFQSIMTDEDTGVADVLRAALYIFILLVQIIAVYYSGSRGPLMGLLFGLGFFVLLILIAAQQRAARAGAAGQGARWRWLWIAALVGLTAAALLFFAINPGGPFHDLALQNPVTNRISRVLSPESGTGKVRALIWDGNIDLLLPHGPIEYPPVVGNLEWSPDSFNSVRPLVGYGPESMYVAYNSFYPPELAHYESRTASPDRSHNETFDALVITGVLGFVAYILLFSSLFYLALKWLGIVSKGRPSALFFVSLLVGAVAFVIWVNVAFGSHFIGLAIPIGMVVGLVFYVLVYGFFVSWRPQTFGEPHPHTTILIGIVCTFVAHLVEINFGISIAATRTTFWGLAGVFVVLGLGWLVEREEMQIAPPQNAGSQGRRRRGRRRRAAAASARAPSQSTVPRWLWPALGTALVGSLILGTLAYDFVNNVEGLANAAQILWRSLTVIAIPANQDPRSSPGILMVFGMTWLSMGMLSVAQMTKRGVFKDGRRDEVVATIVSWMLSMGVAAIFALTLAERHASVIRMRSVEVQTSQQALSLYLGLATYVAGQLTSYYGFLAVVMVLGGMALMGERSIPKRWVTPAGGLVLLAAVFAWLALAVVPDLGQAAEPANVWGQTPLTIIQPRYLIISLLFGLVAAGVIGLMIYLSSAQSAQNLRGVGRGWILALLAVMVLFLAPVAIYYYNLRTIQADIIYKQADPFDRQRHWNMAVPHYELAVEMVPWEDFYYLYLGRALLENASSLDDASQQEMILRYTEQVLLQAQAINPLNTDHSANLARMYSRWSSLPAGQEYRQDLAQVSSSYYEAATTLSPSNAILWNEWALLYYHSLRDAEMYQSTIDHSLELDSEFENTWLIVGDVNIDQGDLQAAAEAYTVALEIAPRQPRVWDVLGQVQLQLQQYEEALEAFSQSLDYAPNANTAWNTHRLMAVAYWELGQNEQALVEALVARDMAPEDQKPLVEQLILQLQQPPVEETTP